MIHSYELLPMMACSHIGARNAWAVHERHSAGGGSWTSDHQQIMRMIAFQFPATSGCRIVVSDSRTQRTTTGVATPTRGRAAREDPTAAAPRPERSFCWLYEIPLVYEADHEADHAQQPAARRGGEEWLPLLVEWLEEEELRVVSLLRPQPPRPPKKQQAMTMVVIKKETSKQQARSKENNQQCVVASSWLHHHGRGLLFGHHDDDALVILLGRQESWLLRGRSACARAALARWGGGAVARCEDDDENLAGCALLGGDAVLV